MTREDILAEILQAAKENEGRPPGFKAFQARSGVTMPDLWKAGLSRYSEAVRAAGLVPNKMTAAYDAQALMRPLAQLVRSMGKFPSKSEFMTAKIAQPDLPSFDTFVRLAEGSYRSVPPLLLKYCQESGDFSDVADLLEKSVEVYPQMSGGASSRDVRVRGYVYLVKHGKDYKIGRSNDVARRRREVALLLPEELRQVHVIETDDPEGIEQYWHRRFEARRVRGEWFRLTSQDLAAFKRRRYQ